MQHSSSNSLRCVFARNFEELRRVVEINATAHALGTYVALAHMQGGTIIQTSSRAGGGPELKRRVGAASLTAKREVHRDLLRTTKTPHEHLEHSEWAPKTPYIESKTLRDRPGEGRPEARMLRREISVMPCGNLLPARNASPGGPWQGCCPPAHRRCTPCPRQRTCTSRAPSPRSWVRSRRSAYQGSERPARTPVGCSRHGNLLHFPNVLLRIRTLLRPEWRSDVVF